MSFSAAILLSTVVSAEQKRTLEHEFLKTWSFLRRTRFEAFSEHLLLAPPETSDELYTNPDALEQAFKQNNQIFGGLIPFSKQFPSIKFAYIEAECYGGVCIYGGYICQAGKTLKDLVASKHGHKILLAEIGIGIEDYFEPFTRRFFDGAEVELGLECFKST